MFYLVGGIIIYLSLRGRLDHYLGLMTGPGRPADPYRVEESIGSTTPAAAGDYIGRVLGNIPAEGDTTGMSFSNLRQGCTDLFSSWFGGKAAGPAPTKAGSDPGPTKITIPGGTYDPSIK